MKCGRNAIVVKPPPSKKAAVATFTANMAAVLTLRQASPIRTPKPAAVALESNSNKETKPSRPGGTSTRPASQHAANTEMTSIAVQACAPANRPKAKLSGEV